MLLKCAFFPGIVQKPLADILAAEFHTEVILNNDAVCSAVGESFFGSGREGKRILCITISTGMGGAFVKKTPDATYIMPAEIGHTIVDIYGKVCECGQKGCIGAYAHGRALEERFLTKPENIEDMRIWEEVAEYLTIGVINGARIFMPDTIVLSGAIVEDREYVLPKIKQLYEKRSVIRPIPEVVKNTLGDNSVLIGALAFLQVDNIVYI
jgi:predicted NBD/HSP70 family sugar kinase